MTETRELGAPMELRCRQIGPWPTNAYALVCPTTGASVLVDPGAEPDELAALLVGTRPVAILLTHTHPDHVGALAPMRVRLSVPVVGRSAPHDEGFAEHVDHAVADRERIQVGAQVLRAWHAPGHIEDQVCYTVDDAGLAIVGDTVFDGGPGKTWSSAGFRTTLETLRNVVLAWPDDTLCLPGHGPSFRLGDRRAAIEAFLAREHGDFHGDATWDTC